MPLSWASLQKLALAFGKDDAGSKTAAKDMRHDPASPLRA
jgi:hypothetical protein